MFNPLNKSIWQDFVDDLLDVVMAVLTAVVVAPVVVAALVAATLYHAVESACNYVSSKFKNMLKNVKWQRVITEIVLILAGVFTGAYNSDLVTNLFM